MSNATKFTIQKCSTPNCVVLRLGDAYQHFRTDSKGHHPIPDTVMALQAELEAHAERAEGKLAAAYDRGYVAGAAALQTVIDRATAAEAQLKALDYEVTASARGMSVFDALMDERRMWFGYQDRALAAEARERDLRALVEAVMHDLEEYGSSIVPHLLDTDQNDGQRLRVWLAAHPTPKV